MQAEEVFWKLYKAKDETEVNQLIQNCPETFRSGNWFPLGGNESNYAVVENQQSNPVAALVEKLTNSIDAILMRKCLEAGLDPKSASAPHSVEEAIDCFFPDHKNWDLPHNRNAQALSIQVLADGTRSGDTSLIIYDDGEGQDPSRFEDTFLSLLRGNKNEIHFVQGKYNMGGSGSIVFCGKHRYQLIASRRYDGSGPFGFTLIRRHPLTAIEQTTKKNTWYEYLKLDGKIPVFNIDQLDLGLFKRQFRTGTALKLYSYDLTRNRHIRRDLSRSLNEFLYEPALPIYMVETAERYPHDNVLQDVVFGLKRELEKASEYVEEAFSEKVDDHILGEMKVTVHVFKARAKGKDVEQTRKYIQNEFFKNSMAVLFSIHGQVHGHYTSEFISRTLKYNLLRDYLLIHVDCTNMKLDFRNELFMASRDRLRQGEESSQLRHVLAQCLLSGKLSEIYKRRKDAISVEGAEDVTLIQGLSENLPISPELRHLLNQTFKIRGLQPQSKSKTFPKPSNPPKPEHPSFNPKRFPSFFKFDGKLQGDQQVLDIPIGGSRVLRFQSDVENEYFDRTEDPGDLKIALLDYKPNDARGGNKKGTANHITDIFSVNRKSPSEGTIRVTLTPTQAVRVGDEARIQVDLTNPAGDDFTHIFWVRLSRPAAADDRQGKPEPENVGLPNLIRVYEHAAQEDAIQSSKTWADLAGVIEMNYDVVMHPLIEGDKLDSIYVNMDSSVLKNYKARLRNPSIEQLKLADRRYMTSVYFHTIFLYVISKNMKYRMVRESDGADTEEVDLTDYLKDLFENQYASFLLSFEIGSLMEGLA